MAATPGLPLFASPSGTPLIPVQQGQALEAWMKSPVQIAVTGKCYTDNRKCEVDMTNHGRIRIGDVQRMIDSLGLPPVFNVSCHPSSPCRNTGDECTWESHPPQSAQCQLTGFAPSFRVTSRSGGGGRQFNGDVIITNGNMFGTSIHINRESYTYQYNGNTYHSDMRCIFDDGDTQDFHESMEEFRNDMQNFKNSMNRMFGPGRRPRGPR